MAGLIDKYMVYQFIRRLVTPFEQMPAFRLGLIDSNGRILKKIKDLKTSQEQAALTEFDVLIINLKRLIGMLPGGKSRLANLAAGLLLLKQYENKQFNLNNALFSLEEDFNAMLEQLSPLPEDAPVNASGTPGVYGTRPGETVVTRKAAKTYKQKNISQAPAIFKRKMPVNEVNKEFDIFVNNGHKWVKHTTYQGIHKGKAKQKHVDTLNPKEKYKYVKVELHKEQKSLNESTLQYHKELNPKLWANGKLKDQVRGKLLQIADAWMKFTRIDPINVYDVIITGGNVNYNYTDLSDIDLHLIISRGAINPDRAFVDEYLQDKKILWSLSHQDINILGYPVELYAQDIDEKPHQDQGVYSVTNNNWIQLPQYLGLDFENDYHLQKKVEFYKNLIDKMISQNATDGSLDMVKQRIKRMRGDSIAQGGEFAFGNLVFKELRNQGYLDKMDAYQKSNQDKALSLE